MNHNDPQVLEGNALRVLAAATHAGGEPVAAARLARDALDILRPTGHRLGIAEVLGTLARALSTSDPGAARKCHKEAEMILDEIGGSDTPPDPPT